ncbi:porin [Polynucleobacter asymbioticus]|uniref:Porin, Gram-negative type n=1 Tax=Polynucleobacter asymbioticus (strain DSM 18221 / CIP 109841 / QLW-P1DMWA-1) TaxID=312153 RepID=A4SV27_POLAQ|nr:porin [Polynucleobacter asymbioticus]ABP33341.1 porin, Gram-negative type [Polynucleobacter asymbioticus QLW-P1DMWA-1]
MKKSLFAVAALSAIAGSAQAQSSVTVYGLLDLGYVGYNTRAATGSTQNPQAVNKTTGNAFSSSAESTSRLGFKGTEDLGGGTSAFFTVELGLTPNNNQAVNTGGTQNRQTFVGLKKNGIGQFALGTQYTVVHNAVAATDPGQANNISGNLIYPATTEGAGSAENSTGAAYTVRTNNQLSLNSDTFAGFKANAMLVANNKNSNETITVTGTPAAGTYAAAGGLNNQNGWGLGLDYTFKNFYATANYQAMTSKQSAQTYTYTSPYVTGITAGAPAQGYAGGSSANGTNVQDNQWYVAATYDFGILKAYAQYITRKVSAQQDNSYYYKRSAEQIGVRSFITPTIEAWVSGGLGRYNGYGANTANLTAWQIGSNYWLSKRTNLYAIYGQVGTSNASYPTSVAGGAQNTNLNPASANISNYAVGVRHTF